jgi:hypothetical protein
MAFEMNIEADQISDSDFNLLHSFVKIPLMILGGVLGRGSGSNLEDDDDDDEGMVDAAMARPTRRNDDPMDCTALTTSLDQINAASIAAGVEQSSSSPSNRIVSDSDIDESDSQNEADGLKRSKKMSWSDSMGHRLVEYDDEVRYQGAY